MSQLPVPVRIAAPVPPASSPPFRFPVIASVAPLVIAVIIWLATGSAFVLLFAGLGPVTAIASYVDSRFSARRLRRRERARFETDVEAVRRQAVAIHASRASALAELTPDARAIAARRGADPFRWSATTGSPVLVALGLGRAVSGVQFDTLSPPDLEPWVVEALDQLERDVTTAEGMPIQVDAELGVGICGPADLAAAYARSLLVQLAWTLAPSEFWVRLGAGQWLDWARQLPHSSRGACGPGIVAEFGTRDEEGARVTLAVASTPVELAARCRVVVQLGGDGGAYIAQHPDAAMRVPVQARFVSSEHAAVWAAAAAVDASREGLVVGASRVPELVEFSALEPADGEPPGLAAAVGRGADAALTVVDLVADGPHAVIGGTTGSGKSELLIAWVLAMAAAHPPSAVVFLLVDFKGGSAFSSLAALPHTVGIITDLDAATAARALDSLRAELRYREHTLALAGVRSIEECAELPRLIIIVDEFAAMLSDHPDLHTLFADIAARGRSLGVHMVLCTQRPAGVVRDGILANADLRISLRVNNRADSIAVVGTADAAEIATATKGRAVMSVGGEAATVVQFALASEADIATVAAAWSGYPAPRRPWCEPLPARIELSSLQAPSQGVPFGVLDLPQHQRRDVAVWDAARDGHLLILGGPASGKTTALATLAARGRVVVISGEIDAAWDSLTALAEHPRPGIVIVDDVDSLLARMPAEHRAPLVERLQLLLRDGPAAGMWCAVSAQRLTAEVNGLAALMPGRLLLRHASRQDYVLAGGQGSQFVDALPAGGGHWNGHRVQVATSHDRLIPQDLPETRPVGTGPLAIVTTRPAALSRMLARDPVNEILELDTDPLARLAAASGRPVIVADVEQWQSRWGSLAALRAVAEILFDSCTPADVRALTRSRELPPPLIAARGECWRMTEDGTVERARLGEPSALAGYASAQDRSTHSR